MTSGRRCSRALGTSGSGWSSTWLLERAKLDVLAAKQRPSREELRALHRRYKETTDPAERDRIRAQLGDAYRDYISSSARKFQTRGEPLDDIVQVGYLGLIKAIDRF